MTTRHKHADLIIAWANGAKIQWRPNERSEWEDCAANKPAWGISHEYRIEPETIKYRVALFRNEKEDWCATAIDKREAKRFEEWHDFDCWLTDWIEVEV